jgi:hypothetical protein
MLHKHLIPSHYHCIHHKLEQPNKFLMTKMQIYVLLYYHQQYDFQIDLEQLSSHSYYY